MESVRRYLDSVGDSLPTYSERGLAPPLAVAAYALGSLLEKLALPPGAIHSLQEIETLAPITFGQRLRGSARFPGGCG